MTKPDDPSGLWPQLRQRALAALAVVLSRKLELTLTALIPTVLGAAIWTRDYLAQFVPQPAEQAAVISTAAALAGLLVSVASWQAFRPKLRHNAKLGVYEDIKTGAYYCVKCHLTTKLRSPLHLTRREILWKCSVCGSTRDNPDYQDPPPPPPDPHGWMRI